MSDEVKTLHQYDILPGTPYSRYLMPLEYLPSRDFHPRWGGSKPPLAAVSKIFATQHDFYMQVLLNMKKYFPSFKLIPATLPDLESITPTWLNAPINPIDIMLLYYFIAHYKPATYLEIGSGMTTLFARRAIKDQKLNTKIISIDPSPRKQVDLVCDQVIREGLENTDLSLFFQLKAGDIIFMDGSHRAFMNSDVTVFMVEVLPYLKPGVIVHIHDILLPYDYPESFKQWYWNEQYFVALYLIAAEAKILPVFPGAYVTNHPLFTNPCLDLEFSENFKIGKSGSLWFTHK